MRMEEIALAWGYIIGRTGETQRHVFHLFLLNKKMQEKIGYLYLLGASHRYAICIWNSFHPL